MLAATKVSTASWTNNAKKFQGGEKVFRFPNAAQLVDNATARGEQFGLTGVGVTLRQMMSDLHCYMNSARSLAEFARFQRLSENFMNNINGDL